MVELLLFCDHPPPPPPRRHNPFNCIDPLFNGCPDETTWSLLDRVCTPMLPNDNTIPVRTDPRSSYRPSGRNPKNCIAIQTKSQEKPMSPNLFVPSIFEAKFSTLLRCLWQISLKSFQVCNSAKT